MNDIAMSWHYISKIFVTAKAMVTNPLGPLLVIPVVTIPVISTAEKAIIFLLILFIVDFITGVLASWVEFKAVKPIVPASGKRYLIQSSKLRLSGVKFVCYALGALSAYGVEVVFVVQKFNASSISTEHFTLTTCVIAFFCTIELYSIFFENVKRMGFDLIAWFEKVVGVVKKAKSKITE